MAYTRQIFSYDSDEDADIHKWLAKLPEKQKSKYIRIALRTYLSYLVDQDHQQAFLSDYKKQIDEQKEYLSHLESQIENHQTSLAAMLQELSEQQEGLSNFLENPKNIKEQAQSYPIRRSSTETFEGYDHPLFNRKDDEKKKEETKKNNYKDETKDDSYIDLGENVLDDLGK